MHQHRPRHSTGWSNMGSLALDELREKLGATPARHRATTQGEQVLALCQSPTRLAALEATLAALAFDQPPADLAARSVEAMTFVDDDAWEHVHGECA